MHTDINDIEHENEVLATLLDIDDLLFQNTLIEQFDVSSCPNIEQMDIVKNINVMNAETIKHGNENEEMYIVENVNVIIHEPIICNNTRSIKSQPKKWKRKTSQRLRMNGQEYIGYQRNGNLVSHGIQRPSRNIQPTCKSEFCIRAKNRFC